MRNLNGNDRRQPFFEVFRLRDDLFEQVRRRAVSVERSGKSGTEPGQVRAAFSRGNVVDKGIDVFRIVAGVLQRDVVPDSSAVVVLRFPGKADNVRVNRLNVGVEVFDKRG